MLKALALCFVLLMVVPPSAAYNLNEVITTTGYLDIYYPGYSCYWEIEAAARATTDNTGKTTFVVYGLGRTLLSTDPTVGRQATYPKAANYGPCPGTYLDYAKLAEAQYVTEGLKYVNVWKTCASTSSTFSMDGTSSSGDANFDYEGTGVCQT